MERCLARLARSRIALRSSRLQSSQRLCSLLLRTELHTYSADSPRSQVWNRKVSLILQESDYQKMIRRGCASGELPGDIVVPFMGDSITDGTIAEFVKKPGDAVVVDDVIARIETDKVTIDVRSPVAGTLKELAVKEEDKVKPGDKIGFVAKGDTSGKSASKEEKAETTPPSEAPKTKHETKHETKPVTKPDVTTKPLPPIPPSPSPPPPLPQLPPKENERRVPMTRLRKRVAARLKDSQNTYAMLTTFNEIDMTNLMALRTKYKDDFQAKHGAKLGFMSGFVKGAVSALQEQPVVNAVIDGDDIIYRDYVDISIAVGTPKGLVVPVVRGVDNMNFSEIEKTIAMLGKKANEGSLSIDDMVGGTFTISNGGVYGSLLSTPIINPPQSAILGMHSIQKRAVVIGDKIVARPMMYVALTYDHRLIDGREAVLFLRRIKDAVEDPTRLVLDV